MPENKGLNWTDGKRVECSCSYQTAYLDPDGYNQTDGLIVEKGRRYGKSTIRTRN